MSILSKEFLKSKERPSAANIMSALNEVIKITSACKYKCIYLSDHLPDEGL